MCEYNRCANTIAARVAPDTPPLAHLSIAGEVYLPPCGGAAPSGRCCDPETMADGRCEYNSGAAGMRCDTCVRAGGTHPCAIYGVGTHGRELKAWPWSVGGALGLTVERAF